MGFFNWIGRLFKNDISSPHTLDQLIELLGDSDSTSSVTSRAAVRHSTVYSCVKIISETTSQLPCILYERQPDQNARVRAKNFYLYDILKNNPSEYQTGCEFWQFIAAAVTLRGMGCAYKNMVGSKIIELIPISPDAITENWHNNGTRTFSVAFSDGTYRELDSSEIFCVKGLTLDGKRAVSPIKYTAEMLGLSIATQDHAAKFFKNGARPSGYLKTESFLKEETVKALKAEWQKSHGGKNAGKTAVLHGGLDYKNVSMTPEDSQLLELMGFNRTEICGIFGVPPFMIGAIETTSSWGTGLAEQSLGFIKYTVGPSLTRIQQRISKDLLLPAQKKRYYAEFLTEQFLKGDSKARNEAYKSALGGTQHPGYMTVNEIRELENLPPLAGGEVLYRPEPSQRGTGENENDENNE